MDHRQRQAVEHEARRKVIADAYIRCFAGTDGATVLADLMDHGFMDRTTFSPGGLTEYQLGAHDIVVAILRAASGKQLSELILIGLERSTPNPLPGA